jgi:hypothetical protein
MALRVNSTGNVELLKYAAATTGTIVGTSSNIVNLNVANVCVVTWNNSSGGFEIHLNGVRTTGSSVQTLSAANARLGAAQDGTNQLSGMLLEGMFEQAVETTANVHRAITYLSNKYGVTAA